MTNKSKLIIAAAAAVLLVILVVVIWYHASPKTKVDQVTKQVEAAEEIDLRTCVVVKEKHAGDYKLKPVGDKRVTFDRPGERTVKYTLTRNKNGKQWDLEYDFEVVDTTPPKIKVKSTLIQQGSHLNLDQLITVKDKVDGKIDAGNVTLTGEIDTNKSGEYPVTLSVTDMTGNEATKDVKLVVVDEQKFMKLIEGLWLNNCRDAAQAYSTAHIVGLTDVSMTQFDITKGNCFMTTLGDIKGEFDGGKVPELQGQQIAFTYIAPDLSKAKGVVDGKEISMDLAHIDDKILYYECGGHKNYCGYTEFLSMQEMDGYHFEQSF